MSRLLYNKKVNPEFGDLDKNWQIKELGIVKLIEEGDNTEYCFNYALPDYQFMFTEDAFDILELDFEKIKLSEAKKGDVVTIHKRVSWKDPISKYDCKHFAIIEEVGTRISNTIIRSKWGILGVFEGRLIDLPEDYGTMVAIWRKKQR